MNSEHRQSGAPNQPEHTESKSIRVGEWCLNAERFSLVQGETENVIGAQNFALLQYLAERPNQLATREQLLENVWRGVIVNDNTLSKAIAELRKALGDESKQARYILTVPRQGYRLIASVDEISADTASVDAASANVKAHTAQSTWWKTVGALLLLLALGVLFVQQYRWNTASSVTQTNTLASRFTRLTPATTEPGLELQPSFSPDGTWLAYVAYGDATDPTRSRIWLKSLNTGQAQALPTSSNQVERPRWSPDGQYLAYLARKEELCQVHIVRLAPVTYTAQEDSVVASCAANTRVGFNSVQWSFDSKYLYFYQSIDHRTRLVQLDWRNNIETPIEDLQPYVFALHPRAAKLAYAEPSAMSTQLSIRDFNAHTDTPLITRNEVFIGLSIDPLTEHIVSTSSLVGGQLETISPAGEFSILWPSTDPLIDPAFSADGKRLAVAQVRFTYDLWSRDIHEGNISENASPLIQSSRFDYSPRYSHSGQRLAFISTRGGVPAVWLANADGSDAKQAFTLPINVWPTQLRWSPDDRYLSMGATNLRAYRFDLLSGKVNAISPSDMAVLNPSWSRDGKTQYLSRRVNDEWQIWQAAVQTDEQTTSTETFPIFSELISDTGVVAGSLIEPAAEGDCLYVLKHGNSEQRGVWCYDTGTKTMTRLLAIDLSRSNWQNFSVNNKGFYYVHPHKGMLTVHYWDKTNGEKALLPLFPQADAGMLFIDFAVSPDEKRVIYTHLDNFESDIMILE